ncbi:superoxide dismutase family protein [Thermomonospora cellulosilytica]|uniref:Cu-Zn family superoxide dismutase n=1 Tax=Thermomonospora cellulosilytica TaxID=1411118 RepID=A0A7W3R917_9ACTN|nr:superoxide dismutase family protein [Thermomonospora cellulosilytica]MBA9003900.1 Cu-Zn family superoxide dismutase [Thermomonospora cellulosilytica]
MPRLKRTALVAALAGAAALATAAPATAVPALWIVDAYGPTYTYDAAYRTVRTHVRFAEAPGGTWVALIATGFPAHAVGRRFGAHVHVNPCGPRPEDAGGHYQVPGAPPGTPLAAREIWLDFTVGRDRVGRAVAARPWYVSRATSRSVVIHEHRTNPVTGDAGGRLNCTTIPFTATGR